MKTICIKTNNESVINYLLENLENLNLKDVCFSCKNFKIFKNFFIHYKGQDLDLFLCDISDILASIVLEFYEDVIAKNLISNEYFYFNSTEKKDIFMKFVNIRNNDIECFSSKEKILFNIFYNFLNFSNKLFLKGFVTFRLNNYVKELQTQIDSAVSQYLIEKEYNEFISLLKLYINTEPCQIEFVHLIYKDKIPILLDKDKNIIRVDSNILNAKFLSDISFSNSDIALNTLLNILPKKIYIHLIDKEVDEFITTIKLIFENKAIICTDCNICRIYSSKKKSEVFTPKL